MFPLANRHGNWGDAVCGGTLQEHKQGRAKTETMHPGDWRYEESNSQEGCKSRCCLLVSQLGIGVALWLCICKTLPWDSQSKEAAFGLLAAMLFVRMSVTLGLG